LGEAAHLLLGEEQVIVHGDLEDATTAADELGGDAELLLDLSRQTGGAGIVASTGAVLDGDVFLGHDASFPGRILPARRRGLLREE
jgi:hypothetical protein